MPTASFIGFMKTAPQLLAEHNAESIKLEERYTQVRDSVGKGLQRSLAIRAALASYDLKLERAVAELDAELKAIEQNFS